MGGGVSGEIGTRVGKPSAKASRAAPTVRILMNDLKYRRSAGEFVRLRGFARLGRRMLI
jgi:hypothetical protein